MDRNQMQKERERLQAALDRYNEQEATVGRHVSLIERIANLDHRIGLAHMPKGPRGEKRPADAIGLAVMVGKIATGEIEEEREPISSAAAELGRRGGKARAEKMTPERRAEIARKAAAARWKGRG